MSPHLIGKEVAGRATFLRAITDVRGVEGRIARFGTAISMR